MNELSVQINSTKRRFPLACCWQKCVVIVLSLEVFLVEVLVRLGGVMLYRRRQWRRVGEGKHHLLHPEPRGALVGRGDHGVAELQGGRVHTVAVEAHRLVVLLCGQTLVRLYLPLVGLEDGSVHVLRTREVLRFQRPILVDDRRQHGSEHWAKPEHRLLVGVCAWNTGPLRNQCRTKRSRWIDGASVDRQQEQVGHHHRHGDREHAQRPSAFSGDVYRGEHVEHQQHCAKNFCKPHLATIKHRLVPRI
mmetsp:Transcript_3912/g.5393  ORF Transcript_3912/g.5393 Transcript_3912/m.5393 type:complete len:248 (-) Transcript_3912:432-1175(-)